MQPGAEIISTQVHRIFLLRRGNIWSSWLRSFLPRHMDAEIVCRLMCIPVSHLSTSIVHGLSDVQYFFVSTLLDIAVISFFPKSPTSGCRF